jgi:predicted metalloendopeptidase
MVAGIRDVYINNMETVSWMDPKTKRMAVKKVQRQYPYDKIYKDRML